MARLARVPLLAVLGVLLAPATAPAQEFQVIDGDEGDIPLRSAGSLVVEWASDPATCAELGRCGLEGVTTWRAPRRGSLRLFPPSHGPASGILSLGDFFSAGGSIASSRVRRGRHLCADATGAESFAFLEADRGRIPFGLRPVLPGVLVTRCGGPVLEDVEGVVPSVAVPYARARRGRMRVDVNGGGEFASHGLRGIVRSTLSLRLGAPQRDARREQPRFRTHRVRYVSNRFRVAEVRGEVRLEVAGAAAEAECAPLDSCGMAGVLRVVPRATAGSAELLARVPARLGRRAALVAVGLRPGPVPRGRHLLFGAGRWAGAGMLVASVGRPDDPVNCRDSVLLRHGLLLAEPRGRRLRFSLHTGLAEALGARTRCPGPLATSTFDAALAVGELPLAHMRRRRVELTLRDARPLADDGWTIAARPDVTIVLERLPPVETVRREPRF